MSRKKSFTKGCLFLAPVPLLKLKEMSRKCPTLTFDDTAFFGDKCVVSFISLLVIKNMHIISFFLF